MKLETRLGPCEISARTGEGGEKGRAESAGEARSRGEKGEAMRPARARSRPRLTGAASARSSARRALAQLQPGSDSTGPKRPRRGPRRGVDRRHGRSERRGRAGARRPGGRPGKPEREASRRRREEGSGTGGGERDGTRGRGLRSDRASSAVSPAGRRTGRRAPSRRPPPPDPSAATPIGQKSPGRRSWPGRPDDLSPRASGVTHTPAARSNPAEPVESRLPARAGRGACGRVRLPHRRGAHAWEACPSSRAQQGARDVRAGARRPRAVFVAVDESGGPLLFLASCRRRAAPARRFRGRHLSFWSPRFAACRVLRRRTASPDAARRRRRRRRSALPGTGAAAPGAARGRSSSPPTSTARSSRCAASGGEPVAATELDTAKEERSHRFPLFLPDGRHFLFGVEPWEGSFRMTIKVGSLDAPSTGRAAGDGERDDSLRAAERSRDAARRGADGAGARPRPARDDRRAAVARRPAAARRRRFSAPASICRRLERRSNATL